MFYNILFCKQLQLFAICAGASQSSFDGIQESEILVAPLRKRSGMEISIKYESNKT